MRALEAPVGAWRVRWGGSPLGGSSGAAAPRAGAGNCRKRWHPCVAARAALAEGGLGCSC
eukprot:2887524-Alexandrium_andersonii.AAC.1